MPGTVTPCLKVSREYPRFIKKETDLGKLHVLLDGTQYVTKLGQIVSPRSLSLHYTFSFKSPVIPQIRTAVFRLPTIHLNVVFLLK